MKSFFLIISVLSFNTFAQTSKVEAKSQKPKRTLPKVNVELNNKVSSNINQQQSPDEENTFSNQLKLGTRFKTKTKSKLFLIDLPSIDVEWAPSLEDSLRNVTLLNTFLALKLLPNRQVFTATSTQGYIQNVALNDENELVNNKYYFIGADTSYSFNLTKKLSANATIGAQISDYLEPSSPTEDTTNDNLEFKAKIAPAYQLNKRLKVSLPVEAKRRLYRERRALLEQGQEGALNVETLDTLEALVALDFKSKSKFLTASLEAGYEGQADLANGAKDYGSLVTSIKLALNNSKFGLDHRFSLKSRDYANQLIDPEAIQTAENANYTQDLYLARTNFEVKNFAVKGLELTIGHELIKNDSNRDEDVSENNIFKLGFKYTL